MKKRFSILVACVIIMNLCACGSSTSTATSVPAIAAPTAAPAEAVAVPEEAVADPEEEIPDNNSVSSATAETPIPLIATAPPAIEEAPVESSPAEEVFPATDISLFTEHGFSMTRDEFTTHLSGYLPHDVVISHDNLYHDDAPWFPGEMFVITSADLIQESRYIRVWYDKGSGLYENHIDAYFDHASDFTDIAEGIFTAIDPEYVRSETFQNDLTTIIDDLNRKSTNTYYIEMSNCVFLYSYTAPYSILGDSYPGFFEIRFVSKPFFDDRYKDSAVLATEKSTAYFPMDSYEFVDAYNSSSNALGTLDKGSTEMQIKGTSIKTIIFMWDVSKIKNPDGMWVIPEQDFNALMVRLVVHGASKFDSNGQAAISIIGESFAKILDPTFDIHELVENGSYSVSGDSFTMTYSHNGFEYKLKGRSGGYSTYYYEFYITLSANE